MLKCTGATLVGIMNESGGDVRGEASPRSTFNRVWQLLRVSSGTVATHTLLARVKAGSRAKEFHISLVGQFFNSPGIKSTGGCTAKVLRNQKWLCRFLQMRCLIKHVMALIWRVGSGQHYPDNGFSAKFWDSMAERGSEAWVMLTWSKPRRAPISFLRHNLETSGIQR